MGAWKNATEAAPVRGVVGRAVRGVVERVFHTTISERGAVVGVRFLLGGFAARFDRDASALTGRVQPVDDELFGGPIHLDDDVDTASARLDELIGDYAGELDPTCH